MPSPQSRANANANANVVVPGLAEIVERCPDIELHILRQLDYNDVDSVMKAFPKWREQIVNDFKVPNR